MSADKLFKDMAGLYVNDEGERLRAESEAFAGAAPFALSKDFDKKVRQRIRMERLRCPAFAIGAAAACLIIALLGINLISSFIASNHDTSGRLTAEVLPENGEHTSDAERVANTTIASTAAEHISDATTDFTRGTAAEHMSDATTAFSTNTIDQVYEPIALAFNMPPDFAVSGIEQDMGQTIFFIEDAANDDIVMTAERTLEIGGSGRYDEASLIDMGLIEISINGTQLYAIARADYSYFTFKKDEIVYCLTCQYDYMTIISLCEYIL